jgi:uncharacterized protein YwqG
MNKLEQARDIVLNYDYPEDELANCIAELTEWDVYFNGEYWVPLRNITPEVLAQSLVHYINLKKEYSEETIIPMGSSKFFGAPHLPKEVEWPKGHSFYAQLNFSEIKPFDPIGLLPDSGILYLFLDDKHFTCTAIYYHGPADDLALRDYPDVTSTKKNYISNPETIQPFSEFAFLSSNAYEFLEDLLAPVVEKIKNATNSQVELESSSSTKMFGDATYFQTENIIDPDDFDPTDEAYAHEARDHFLLLEKDEGSGNIHFWIPKEDLKKRNFDNIQITYSGT